MYSENNNNNNNNMLLGLAASRHRTHETDEPLQSDCTKNEDRMITGREANGGTRTAVLKSAICPSPDLLSHAHTPSIDIETARWCCEGKEE